MQIAPVSPILGAEITGVQVSKLTNGEFESVREVFLDRSVVFFRDQELSPEQHIEFAQRWGDIDFNAYFGRVEGHPEIAEVLKEPDQRGNVGGAWHTDHSYDVEPAMGSILRAIDVPSEGGDTLFASMGAAYDSLSDAFQEMLAPLRAFHTNGDVFSHERLEAMGFAGRIMNPDNEVRSATHPVVISHPDTGRKLLYVNPGFTRRIEGFSAEESKALLDFLYAQASDPARTIRFRWQPGSVAFWDNRATWHWALDDYPGERRYLHRITVSGCPVG
ncbi:MAG: TauD/TfdA family dioxygenase [Actinomycetota bacterium]|jgi:taurine dioxygenase|nr:TauD/TfdA family dioxygenase [Actinomycetota bacterium]